jgi:hypothetical protein
MTSFSNSSHGKRISSVYKIRIWPEISLSL